MSRMRIKTLIVDDEAMARKSLEHFCKKIDVLDIVGTCEDGVEALNVLKREAIDLLFLDVEMPNLTGLELIESLSVAPTIVLTTSKKEYAVKAFEHRVFDYLVKPVSLPRLMQCVDNVVNELQATIPEQSALHAEHFYVKIDNRLVKIDFHKLLIAEAQGDYVTLRTTEKNYLVHTTLKRIKEKLPDNLFLQVHRSYIINLREIIDIEDSSILIRQEIIPVSRANREELMKRLNTM